MKQSAALAAAVLRDEATAEEVASRLRGMQISKKTWYMTPQQQEAHKTPWLVTDKKEHPSLSEAEQANYRTPKPLQEFATAEEGVFEALMDAGIFLVVTCRACHGYTAPEPLGTEVEGATFKKGSQIGPVTKVVNTKTYVAAQI